MQATVTVAYVNKERPEKHEKKGTIKTSDGRYYKVWPSDLGLFAPGGVYEIEYSTYQQNGQTRYGFDKLIRTVSEPAGDSNGSPAPSGFLSGPVPPIGKSRETQARIERQHSQSAAIEWLSLIANATGKTPTLDDLDTTTDWFQLNIGKTPAKQAEDALVKAMDIREQGQHGGAGDSEGFDL